MENFFVQQNILFDSAIPVSFKKECDPGTQIARPLTQNQAS